MSAPDEVENPKVVELDTTVRAGRRDSGEGSSLVTAEAVRRLESLGEQHGRRELPPAYRGSFGRTLFDTPGSSDGELTVVMHADEIEKVTSQALLRIASYPDDRRYVATVTAGPFYDPDGIRADSTALVISAVNGAIGMPGHHGRVEVSILGAEIDGRIGPANRRPMPNSPVFTVRDDEMAHILGLEGDFPLGVVMGHQSVEVLVPVHKKSVLYRHTAVLGTTGGGKSTTVTNYVAGLSRHGAAVILLDTEGEYTTIHEVTDNADMLAMLPTRKIKAEGMASTHVYTLVGREPSNPDHPNSSEFSLDFTVLSPWAVIEILDLNEAQQSRFLTAYELARKLLQEVGVYPESKNREQEQEALEYDELERGYPKLELALLLDVVSYCIAKVSGQPPLRSVSSVLRRTRAAEKLHQMVEQATLETNKYSWMKVSGLLWRLQRLKIFDRTDAPKLDTKTMLQPGRVNIIDLSGLDSPILRNLAIAQILRETQAVQEVAYAAATEQGKMPTPINIVIEEAHEFLSTSRIRQMPTLYDQVAKIAKRGRKRWLGLTFVTQLPQNMPDEVSALVNNWILHKIQDESVVGRLRRTIPAIDTALWRMLASLQPGQAVVSLSHMRRPILTVMDPSPYRLRMEI
jgi:DNA helicase HerA-like ATPase